ncbi:uncharacterized protein LOC110989944 [Acanthaster planci]|uniref:Uncharacterized protein LOC110989944 n=1 Tax=Acanthaster planci TaxID=133434 RepID=A0A8B8A399_ACAPL|nr:uncharacterized protein LOC110989944 [Acanthaster planci]XP_022110361.1 uncharacterized protein LOC110989944 [Acanthaster planci]
MTDLSAIRDDGASPYDSLARAKAILRETTERAMLESRRIEKQRGLQRSMLEYTEHARKLRRAHLELAARAGGVREPTVATSNRLQAALSYKPRKGRSPLRTSDDDLRRLYGSLTDADKKALEDRYLPEILQSGTGLNRSTGKRPGKQRGEGTDFWDIVQKDGTVKRVVILRTDDQFDRLQHCKTQRHSHSNDASVKANKQKPGGFISYRSDDVNAKASAATTDAVTLTETPLICDTEGDSSGVGGAAYHPGILPRPRPVPQIPTAPTQKVQINISLPRVELDTPSPEPVQPMGNVEEENALAGQKTVCLKHGLDMEYCKKCVHPVGSLPSTKNPYTTPEPLKRLKIPSLTYPIEQPIRIEETEKTQNTVSHKPLDQRERKTAGTEVTQSMIGLDSDLAYHRGFTVNASVQSLPSRMEGILKKAMSSIQRDPGHGPSVSSDSPRLAEPASSSGTRTGPTCRHGHIVSNCKTCRTVEEIQRRLKTDDFRREMRQSFHWDLQAGTALSKSSRWRSQRGKSNLVPHLREIATRKKQTSTARARRAKFIAKTQPSKSVNIKESTARTSVNSILKASTESLRQKKSVRFYRDDIYHPMTGYHLSSRDSGNAVSAS